MGIRRSIQRFVGRFSERPKASPETEIAAIHSAFTAVWKDRPFDPDALVGSKGKGLALYRDMLRDPKVKGAFLGKVFEVIARDWSMTAASADESDREIAEFCTFAFENSQGLFSDSLRKVLWALVTGVSIAEKVWGKPSSRGRFGEKVTLKALKDKDPDDFDFRTDDFGNCLALIQFPDTGDERELDPAKFIVFSHLMEYGNLWGTSDFRAAYRAFWLKDSVMKFRAIFAERHAVPTVIAKYARGCDPTDVAKLREIIQHWQNETGVVIADDQILELLQKSTAAEDVYHQFIDDCNEEIVFGIQGAVLQAIEGAQTGARAASETHSETAAKFTDFLSRLVEETVNEDLVRPLVDWNYDTEEYPRFGFVKPRGDMLNEAQRDAVLIKELGLPVAAAWLYEKYGVPMPTDEDELLEVPVAPAPVFGQGPSADSADERRREEGERGKGKGESQGAADQKAGNARFAEARAQGMDQDAAESQAIEAGTSAFARVCAEIQAAVSKKKVSGPSGVN